MPRKPAKQSTPKTATKKTARKSATKPTTAAPKAKRQASAAAPKAAKADRAQRTAAPRGPATFAIEVVRIGGTDIIQWPANWAFPVEGAILQLNGEDVKVTDSRVTFRKAGSGRSAQKTYGSATIRLTVEALDAVESDYDDEDDEDEESAAYDAAPLL